MGLFPPWELLDMPLLYRVTICYNYKWKVQKDSLLVALVVASVIVGQLSFLLNEQHESQNLESSCIKSAIRKQE